jgi:sugar (pentulose or hexulose) kinase
MKRTKRLIRDVDQEAKLVRLPFACLTPKNMFLGLDLSTQQLKAVVLDKHSKVVHRIAVNFDRDLPHYGTTNGAVRGPDEGEVTSPVQMWLEAVDLLFARLHGAGVDLGAVVAVSGAGQVRVSATVCLRPGSDVL